MRLGVVFPQTEIGADPVSIRDYAQAAEALGYDHLLAYDHVLGANPDSRPDWAGYRHTDMFHEPFVLFSYLAGITHKIEFVSGIIILPQRQTVLVAKQAAALNALSGGRLRLESESAGTRSSTRPSARTSTIGAAGPKSRSTFSDSHGPTSL